MFIKKNNAKSTINMGGGLSAGALSLTVTDGSKFPSTFPFLITLWDKSAYPDPSDDSGMEIVKCTARTGNVLTIVRAQEGTSDQAHTDAEAVEMLITSGILQEYDEKGDVEVDADSGTVNPASYTQRARLTFTPVQSGNYMVRWQTEYSAVNNKPIWIKLEQDDTTILNETKHQTTTAGVGIDFMIRSGFKKVTLVGGTPYNFNMDYHSDSQNMSIRRSRITIERWS